MSEEDDGCMNLPEGVLIDMITNDFSMSGRKCEFCEMIGGKICCGYGILDNENSYIFGWQDGESEDDLTRQNRRLKRYAEVMGKYAEKQEDKKVCAHINVLSDESGIFKMVHLFLK